MKNRAMYMTDIKQMQMREIALPTPNKNEVIVKVEYIGICGSDLHYFEHGRIGDYVVDGDFILGHECAGVVTQIGENVTRLKKGDRVALEPGKTCGNCEYCKSGKYNLCSEVEFLATPPYNGCLVDYLSYPEELAFKLPDEISNKEGALIEPLSVGIHAAKQGNVSLGDTVVIFGAGSIGLSALLASKANGATNVIVVDVLEKRLEYAKKLGANSVINSKKENVANRIYELTKEAMAKTVIETAGAEETLAMTPNVVKKGGCIVLVGLTSSDNVPYNFLTLIDKEIEIKTVFRYRNIFPIAINAVADNKIDISSLITHEFKFEDSENAFKYVLENKKDVIKAIIKM